MAPMNRDDGPLGTAAAAQLLRVLTPANMAADAELEALRAEHAALTRQVAALPSLVLPPRVLVPLVAVPVACTRCEAMASEYRAEYKTLRAAVERERALALKTAEQERKKRLGLEAKLAEAHLIIASLRRARTLPALGGRGNPRRYGA